MCTYPKHKLLVFFPAHKVMCVVHWMDISDFRCRLTDAAARAILSEVTELSYSGCLVIHLTGSHLRFWVHTGDYNLHVSLVY